MEPEIIAILAGSGLFGAAAYLFGRGRVPKPEAEDPDVIISTDLQHVHSRWKKGEDGIYFCVECLDRYLDGKPK